MQQPSDLGITHNDTAAVTVAFSDGHDALVQGFGHPVNPSTADFIFA